MGLITPLPDIENLLPWVSNYLHPGSWVVGESKVQSLDLNQVIHLCLDREFINLLKLIDDAIQDTLKSATIDLPPICI